MSATSLSPTLVAEQRKWREWEALRKKESTEEKESECESGSECMGVMITCSP